MSHNFAQIRPEIGRKSDDFRHEKNARAFGPFGSGFGRAGPGQNGPGGRAFKARPEARPITMSNSLGGLKTIFKKIGNSYYDSIYRMLSFWLLFFSKLQNYLGVERL